MKSRRIATGCLVLAVISLLCWLVAYRHKVLIEEKINPESFEQISEGLSRVDVEQLLGGPAGNYARRTNRIVGAITNFGQEYWRGTYHYIAIVFDAQDRVVMKCIHETEEAPEGYRKDLEPR